MNLVSKFWLLWNWLTCLPLVFCCIYSFIAHSKLKEDHKGTRFLTLSCRILLYPAGAYYILDSIALIRAFDTLPGCNSGFLLHHIITLLGFNASLTVPIFPWFFLICFQIHCLLIMFPYNTELNYVYLAAIINCLYRIKQDPWASHPNFIKIFKVIVALVCGPLVILWWFECKNDMLNVA